MRKLIIVVQVLLVALCLTGCAQSLSPNTYTTNQVNQTANVEKGVVVSKRLVTIDNKSGVGGLVGAGMGSAAGSLAGQNVATNIVGSLGGALIGGILGNTLDKGVHSKQGIEYIVKLHNGKTIAVAQTKENELAVNQKVLVLKGKDTRLIADNSIA